MKNHVWILIVVTLTASAAANAGEYWNSCNSCSETQLQRAALRAVDGAIFGRHDVYVVDFGGETVRKFGVWREYDAEFRVWESSAWPVPVESHVGHEFAQVVSAMKADVASLESGKLVPADVVDSAYDIVHNSVNRQRVANYIKNHMSFWESIGAPAFVPLSLLRKVVDLNLTVSVIFADGSTAKFVLTGVDGSLGELDYVFELVDGSARDADGNIIPVSIVEAAPFEGTFSSELAAQRMVDFIRMWYVSSVRPVIECYSTQIGNNIIVTCRRN